MLITCSCIIKTSRAHCTFHLSQYRSSRRKSSKRTFVVADPEDPVGFSSPRAFPALQVYCSRDVAASSRASLFCTYGTLSCLLILSLMFLCIDYSSVLPPSNLFTVRLPPKPFIVDDSFSLYSDTNSGLWKPHSKLRPSVHQRVTNKKLNAQLVSDCMLWRWRCNYLLATFLARPTRSKGTVKLAHAAAVSWLQPPR